jgi:aldehyde dehydrogenase
VSALSETEIRALARELATRLGAPAAPSAAASPSVQPAGAGPALGEGIHADVDSAVAAAGRAFRALAAAAPSLRARLVDALRTALLPEAARLGELARAETGLGRAEDKALKNRLVTLKTPGPETLGPRAQSGDRGLVLMEPAPFGVIAAITPITNPTSTVICNAIGMLAAGNAVVFNPHPGAAACSAETVRLINRALADAGGPPDLVTAVAQPTIESAQALMRHPGIRLLVVTGGSGVVREAMASGKRAICAGPGNPPVVVDETADLEQAGRDIVFGASLDNNIICVDEKEVFVVDAAAAGLVAAMQRHGARLLTAGELSRLEPLLFAEQRGPGRPGVIAKRWIGQDAAAILAAIGAPCDPAARLLVASVAPEHPLVWTEQMMPVLPVVRVTDADTAIDLAVRAEHGFGHSAAMHSHRLDRLSRMARAINTSIFVKNGPCAAGLGQGGEGYCSFSIASPTGEGLTGPHSFSRERRCVLVDHFRIV